MTGQAPSLQRRLLLGALAVVLLLWCATSAFVWWDAKHEVDELLDAHLAQSAALLVAQGAHGSDNDEGANAPLLHPYARFVAFQVWHEGKLISHSPNTGHSPLSSLQEGFEMVRLEDDDWRLFASRGTESDLQIYVAERLSARGEIVRAILDGLLLPVVFVLPLAALAVWGVVRKGLAPLRTLSATLAMRSPQALEGVSLPGETPGELKPLLHALNQLFDRIRALLDNERRFTADAAHELRTPIAAIRAQAQVAMGAADETQRQHALQSTLMGCDRATHLVEQLLTLSRLEAAEPGDMRAPVNLGAVAQRVVAELTPAALRRGQTVSLHVPVRCLAGVNEALAGVLMRNLVDNALRYSPEGGTVQVSLEAVGENTVMLCVEDSGPCMSEDDLQRLGERFFRALGNDAPGSGLGWSIVRRIAKVQSAHLALQCSAALGGLAVTVAWPAVASS
ncbi:MAG: sensor histidine kinase N-terminal domain-containing protein [Burkholderiales bacterium]|nr:sensor histidine kinase N-terminal domain-containing protein [Burkholderiales bacterium]